VHSPGECADPKNHCYEHNEDEYADDDHPWYLICGECYHVFRTADELLAEHNRVIAELNDDARLTACATHAGYTPGCFYCLLRREHETAGPMPPEQDVRLVHTCPFCAHDL
jgi:hypothetical protein